MNNPPKSRKDDLVIQELDGEVMVYDLKENKALCLNQTSALIWQLCDGKQTQKEISIKLSEKLKSKANEELIWFALGQLKKEKLIENGNELTNPFVGMHRREILKKVGLGTMIALPVVASIVTPNPIMAASCLGLNASGCTAAPNNCCPNSPTLNCNTTPVTSTMVCCLGTGYILTGTASTVPNVNGNCATKTDADCAVVCCDGAGTISMCTGGPAGQYTCTC